MLLPGGCTPWLGTGQRSVAPSSTGIVPSSPRAPWTRPANYGMLPQVGAGVCLSQHDPLPSDNFPVWPPSQSDPLSVSPSPVLTPSQSHPPSFIPCQSHPLRVSSLPVSSHASHTPPNLIPCQSQHLQVSPPPSLIPSQSHPLQVSSPPSLIPPVGDQILPSTIWTCLKNEGLNGGIDYLKEKEKQEV